MNQGPPCPNCGSLLRWYSDQQQWGCDTCRVMFPPQVMIHPQDYATGSPRKKGPTRSHAPIKKWRPLPVAIAALLLLGILTAVTLVLLHKPPPKVTDLDGYADLETAVRETFRALSASDILELAKKSGTGMARVIADCDDGHQPTPVSDELTAVVEHARGTAFSVTKIDEPKPAKVIARGEPLSRGCKLNQPLAIHTVVVQLALQRDGVASKSEATLEVSEAGGKFFVAHPPKLGGCDGAIARLVQVQAEASKVEAPLVAACSADAWAPKVVECLTHALQLAPDVKSCLSDLAPAQLDHVRTAVAAVPALAAIAPAPPGPTLDPNATVGAATPLGIADFWVAPRSDGAFVVTSPLVTAVFPVKPTAKAAPSAKPNADGKRFDIYTITAQPPGGAVFELELIAMGRNMRDRGGLKEIETELRKHGEVTKTERTEDNQPITRFDVKANGVAIVVDAQIDPARGLIASSSANGAQSPLTEAFLASVHLRSVPDAVADPATLTGVRSRAAGKKLVLHDAGDTFTLELPAKPEIKRTVDAAGHAVVVTASSMQKRARYVVTISELSAWDALAIGPTKLAELQSKKTKGTAIWNPFQHRLFRLVCTDTPCDAIAKSLHVADPVAK